MKLTLPRAGVALILTLNSASAAEPSARGLGLFADYIEPMFKQHCYECHSHGAKKIKGGLLLDSRHGVLKGGEFGAALVPGKPEESLLLKAISYSDPDLEMPPKQKLDPTLVDHVREWIALGAPDPREGADIGGRTVTARKGPNAAELWSLRPLHAAPVPAVRRADWPRGAVDRFVLAAQEAKGLSPSGDASSHIILRRLHDVLTGLPPTVEEGNVFLAAAAKDLDGAIAAKVDALMTTRHFGERWGRHWLDLARYCDVNGATDLAPLKQAWRYRDYVIDAFNRDKPWDDFVREQIAGDLLPAAKPEERTTRDIATGFLALAHVQAVDRNPEKFKLDVMDEQMEVLGKTFLGIQIGCARCHDHKVDPLPTRDYYALAGIFRSTLTFKAGATGNALPESPTALAEGAAEWPSWLRGGDDVKIHAVRDEAKVRDEAVHLRGETAVLGAVVPRGFPALLPVTAVPAIPPDSSGRLELADWLLSRENPLTARVIVNRVWHHVFGSGIVRSTDNFGFSGDAPSHPELLDFLARRFRDQHHGSFKSLIRELLLSRSFRQDCVARKEAAAVDPENRLLWRAHVHRRDAEALVDSMRFVAGTLDLTPTTFSVPKFRGGNQSSTANLEVPPETLSRRAVYWPVFRKDTPIVMDLLALFDFPNSTAPLGTREEKAVPSQSLALLNSPMVLDSAGALARNLPDCGERGRVDALYRRVLSRAPTAGEATDALDFLDSFTAELTEAKAAKIDNARQVAWNRLCHTLLMSNEFIVLE